MGKKVPSRAAANVAVICRLSPSPITSTCLLPAAAIVQSPVGTSLIPVWSRLRMRLSGMSRSVTILAISFRNVLFTSAICSPDRPGVDLVVALHLTNPILCSSDRAHALVICMCPPCCTSMVLSCALTIPSPTAITILEPIGLFVITQRMRYPHSDVIIDCGCTSGVHFFDRIVPSALTCVHFYLYLECATVELQRPSLI